MPDTPVLWRAPVVVNTFSGTVDNSRVVELSNGNILVAWDTDASGGAGSAPGLDVLGQLYAPDGSAIGENFLLTSRSGTGESDPSIVALPGGGFAVAYEQPNIANGAINLYLDTYNSAGELDFDILAVADSVGSPPNVLNPSIAVSGDNLLLVYEKRFASSSEILGVIYDTDTGLAGPTFEIRSADGYLGEAEVVTLTNGNFAVAYRAGTGNGSQIETAVLTSTGAFVRSAFAVEPTYRNGTNDFHVDIEALTNGGYIIVYSNTTGADTDVRINFIRSDGVQTTILDASHGAGPADNKNEPSAVALDDGGFILLYDEDGQPPGFAGAGQRFAASFAPVGVTFNFDDLTGNWADGAQLSDGRTAIVWDDGDINLAFYDTRDVVNAAPAMGRQFGTTFDDIFTMAAGAREAYGAGGFNRITGTTGNDRMYGGDARDTLFGGNGNDLLDGGPGIDRLEGGLGNDIYILDRSDDVIAGEIAFSLNGGIDTVRVFFDNYVQPENIELVRITNLTDTQNYSATGNDAPGTLVGNAGANVLTGRGGNDQINGNGGDDRLIGNTGRDTLVGGTGADTFVYASISESRAGAAERDVINGFDRGADIIDLSAMDANLGLAGEGTFTFIGTDRFSGNVGELRLQSLGGPNAVLVEGDLRGDGMADFQIFVNLTTVLGAEDFIL